TPERVASERLLAAAFRVHPYGRPVLGSAPAVAALTHDQVAGFLGRHYVARNVTLVVVGDFDARQARAKVAAAFASMARGDAPAARPAEPAQTAPRTIVATHAGDGAEAQLLLSFHTPGIAHDDVAALDLAAALLGLGQSEPARLEPPSSRGRAADRPRPDVPRAGGGGGARDPGRRASSRAPGGLGRGARSGARPAGG